MAKYLKITNKPCTDSNTCFSAIVLPYDGIALYLNNGACVGFFLAQNNFLKQTAYVPGTGNCNPDHRIASYAALYMDINGNDGTN